MAVETRVMNCIMCPMGCEMTVTIENGAVTNVTGNTCPRGAKYANDEVHRAREFCISFFLWVWDFGWIGFAMADLLPCH